LSAQSPKVVGIFDLLKRSEHADCHSKIKHYAEDRMRWWSKGAKGRVIFATWPGSSDFMGDFTVFKAFRTHYSGAMNPFFSFALS
jgi:hypothetical protein